MVKKSGSSNANARTRLPPLITGPVITNSGGEPDALSSVSDIPRSLASEGRLGKVNELAARRREHVSIMNDLQKEKLKLESSKLEKQIMTLTTSFEKDIEPVKRSYEELKATRLYWEWKRSRMKEQTKLQKGIFGSCGGTDKYERRREMKKLIDAARPSQQRQRRVKKFKEMGREKGGITDDVNVMNKFNAMMNKPFRTHIQPKPKVIHADKKLKHKRSFRLPPLAAVVQSDKGYGNFYSSGPLRLVLENS